MSDEKKALVPIEQKTVLFYEDEITAILVEVDSKQRVYIPIRPIIERLGLNWAGQRQRIMRDLVLSAEVIPCVVMTHTQGQPDQRRELLCLPLDFLSGFLFTVDAHRVRPELQERLIRYQKECYRVLAEAFQEGRLTADSAFDDLLQEDTPATQAYKMIAAMMQLARQQVMLEARLNSQSVQIENHEQRLEYIETQLGDQSRAISESQAMQISQAVKAIGMVWSKQEKKNLYGAVYGRLYEEFEIAAYRQLPARRFKEAMAWLTQWYVELTGQSKLPF